MMLYQAEALDLENTVLDTVAKLRKIGHDDIKGLLGRCNFRDDMLDRKVQFLSGGEKVMHVFSTFFTLVFYSSQVTFISSA